ncbi:MAG: hypothetical protein E6K60_03315 [Nitrospirae bacterium]|nr:MAG: hypothetical protein E6K60_03315 [Nitrospirota bacterium]
MSRFIPAIFFLLIGAGAWFVPVASAEEPADGNYWALIIGINKYPNLEKDKQVEAARGDAEAVAKMIVDRYGFAKKRMIELYDISANRKAILHAFSQLKKDVARQDSLFIYYAGNGVYESTQDKDRATETGFWLPTDAEQDDPSSYIFNSQVKDFLSTMPARHVYLVVDAAFSTSLIGRTISAKAGSREPFQEKSRVVLSSGWLKPMPDKDKTKKGHSAFAWHFLKILEQNTNPILPARDIAEPLGVRVTNEPQGKLPKSGPVIASGDEGGQFTFRLAKDAFDPEAEARLKEMQRQNEAAQKELRDLEEQLKEAEEKLKKGK